MISYVVLTFLIVHSITKGIASPVTKQVKMPDTCANQTFCFDKDSDYPQKAIDEILKKLDFSIVIDDDVEISDRSGDGHPVHDCESDPRFDPIYEIVDEDDNVRYVVQSEKMYEQKIKTETCIKPGKLETSAYLSPYQLREYNLTCFERKIEYWFTVLSLDRTQIETVKIKEGLPVCCSCRLTQ